MIKDASSTASSNSSVPPSLPSAEARVLASGRAMIVSRVNLP